MGRSPRSVVSFGGGVQSTALALLALENHPELVRAMGEAIPRLWLFADTGDEPRAVYAHVDRMRERIVAAGLDFVTVSAGRLSDHVIEKASAGQRGISMPPMFVKTRDGDTMPVRRGCTRDFKAKPLDAEIRRRCGVRRGYKGDPFVRQWYGISADESQRMRISQDAWRTFEYPLVRMGWSRERCHRFLDDRGVNAPRSACVFCPFHSASEWRRIMADPYERARVEAFEASVHRAYQAHGTVAGLDSRPYLHRSRIAIGSVDHDGGQRSLWSTWDQECSGVCGV